MPIANGAAKEIKIKIVVATHKPYRMPDDPMYLPLHAGHAGKEDDTGDNISTMNPTLCELTCLYWAWKNLDADAVGLAHYRRHFTRFFLVSLGHKDKFARVLTERQAQDLLNQYDIILPKPRRYYIETLYSHFIHLPYAHEKDLQTLRETIQDVAPDYLDAFDTVMGRTHAHMFNMFIMKREIFDAYCAWMFPILLEADKRIDVSGYTPMEARAVAYFGEFMLDIWNEKQKIPYIELPVLFMEKQNWLKKGGKFLAHKVMPPKS